MWKEEDVQFHEVGRCFDHVELMYHAFVPHFFTLFYSSDSCGFNAYNFVQKEAVIHELFTNYYASGACTRAHHQNQPFLEKNRVRALSSASSCNPPSVTAIICHTRRKYQILSLPRP